MGKQGMFRVEQTGGDTAEVRVSDGKITWKALPKQKLWSKSEVAQMVDLEADDDTPDDSAAQDLFTQTQRSFVTRYTALARYANVATLEKSDKVKFDGNKVECYVVRISTKRSNNRLFIAKDSFLVLRHSEVQDGNNGPKPKSRSITRELARTFPLPTSSSFSR